MSAAEAIEATEALSPDAGTTPMIEVSGLHKLYGNVKALRGISFTVGRGEIVGLLGPNGAGKTTTMKILTGYISATAGTYRVAGYDGYTDSLEVRKMIGYLPENAPLYPDMGVIDYLNFVCQIRRIPKSKRSQRIAGIVSQCGLGAMAHKDIGALSKGYRQRVGLAQAMIHEPPILILDEPTNGLDPNQIVEIRNLIKELGKDRTIILSTHNLPEVQMTCTRMIIISDGQKVADGSAEELQQTSEQARFVVTMRMPDGDDKTAVVDALRGVPGVADVASMEAGDGALRAVVTATGNTDLSEAIYEQAVTNGWTLRELRRDVADLEKIFHKLTQF
jgi:ABC-2 type transport system ATP-binding protein